MKVSINYKILIMFALIAAFIFISADQTSAQTEKEAKKTTDVKADTSAMQTSEKSKECGDTCLQGQGQGRGKGYCRMKDQFIDNDKDGINDNRCNGIGFGKQHRKGKCRNKISK